MPKITVINYATHDHQHKLKRHMEWVKHWTKGWSDVNIVSYCPDSLDNDFRLRNEHILRQPRGAGYWLWKPYVLALALNLDTDYVVYCDVASVLLKPLRYYIDILSNNTATAFVYHAMCYEYQWTKRDLLIKLDADNNEVLDTHQIAATAHIWKTSELSRKIVDHWLTLCQDAHNITDSASVAANHCGCRGHRHDQSVFSLVLKKHYLNDVVLEPFDDNVGHHHITKGYDVCQP